MTFMDARLWGLFDAIVGGIVSGITILLIYEPAKQRLRDWWARLRDWRASQSRSSLDKRLEHLKATRSKVKVDGNTEMILRGMRVVLLVVSIGIVFVLYASFAILVRLNAPPLVQERAIAVAWAFILLDWFILVICDTSISIMQNRVSQRYWAFLEKRIERLNERKSKYAVAPKGLAP